ncbi:MAG: 16S rRNA (cytosine(967)-C(5))-methyltransferase RsmB [Lachnospiraceae bacterium]|nr:16S rRNA (cytosine(967)-C(5))-methyltransferase RsmB [Lachnospiraceae bacterium]
MLNTRDIALSILMDVDNNKTFSNIATTKALRQNQFSDKVERAFLTRLAEGTIEYQIRLDYVLDSFSKTKMKKCKPLIRNVLRMGAYQILFMDTVPDSAACNECVKLVKKHGFASLSGFVNGVLRNVSRNKNNIKYPDYETEKIDYLSIYYSTPRWLVEKIISDYPKEGEQIIKASYIDRKTTIRVNENKILVEDFAKQLLDKGINVAKGNYSKKALCIDNYDFVRRIPGYREGYFTVQDESSMCAIEAAGIKEGYRIIDVCAAPGGKTTAAAEMLNGTGSIISMDLSSDKLSLIEENVNRLGFDNITVAEHDARELIEDYIEQMDLVIADVPCSGLGIIGRKNDIKYRLTEKQLKELVELQRQILSTAHRYVKKGGTLLFSTCTINKEENYENVKWFLANHPEFKMESQRLFLQGVDKCDGFYYAVIKHQ